MAKLLRAGSQLLGGGGGLAVPAPAYGNELVVNGDFSAWSAGKPTGWSITESAPTNEVTQVGAGELHGGSGTGKCNIYRTSTAVTIQQTILTVDTWYKARITINAASGGSIYIRDLLAGVNGPETNVVGTYVITGRAKHATAQVTSRANGSNVTIDDVSFVAINLASMFSTKDYGALATPTVKAKVTIADTYARTGVVGWLDSKTSPANLVMASVDGSYARMSKLVGGTWTDVIAATAITYVAGALLEIRRAGSNVFSLWYNGAQVGTNQTISDAGIISNTLYGYMNTDAANTVSGLVVV